MESSVPPDKQVSIKPCSDDTQDYKQRIVSLKEFANDSNFAQKAAAIDFGKLIENIENSNEFSALKEEPKTYDVIGFKVIKNSVDCIRFEMSFSLFISDVENRKKL